MANNPFNATVGLKGITSPEPAVLVNNLTGITTAMVSALINVDAPNASTVWESIKTRGLDKLRNIIESELTKSVDFQYIKTKTGSLVGDPSDTVLLPAPVFDGYGVMAAIGDTDELYLNSLSLSLVNDTPVTTTIKVYSATGKLLFTKPVTVQPDYNELVIGYGIRAEFGRKAILFVGIDSTNLSLRTQGTGQDWECTEPSFALEPVSAPLAGPFSTGTLTYEQATGIKLNAVIRRSLLDVIARYSDRLLWAYANVCGSLLMGERRGSTNVNVFTNTLRDTVEELEAKFMDEAIMLAKPVARDMLKELAKANAVTDVRDQPFDPGYSSTGFV